MTDSKNKKMISGEMLVGQIVNEYPQAVEILMEVGMHSRCRRPLCKADYKAQTFDYHRGNELFKSSSFAHRKGKLGCLHLCGTNAFSGIER